MRGLALYGHDENGQIEHDVVGRIQGRAIVRAVVKSAFQGNRGFVRDDLADNLAAQNILYNMMEVYRHVCRTRARVAQTGQFRRYDSSLVYGWDA